MVENFIYLCPAFFLTALVYSMAGLGGGSTYLALLALLDFPHESIRSIALLCNIAVVSFGFVNFYKAGHFSLKKILPFVMTSVPMAYWGGTILLGKKPFTFLLGISLCVAAVRLFLTDKNFTATPVRSWKKIWLIGLSLGAVLGFLSGLVGIGGGIYLAPVLLLFGWMDVKQAAAASSFFILVNSVAGLSGQMFSGSFLLPAPSLFFLLGAVMIGGQIGSRWGAIKIPRMTLQRVTASLILWVSGRLLWSVL